MTDQVTTENLQILLTKLMTSRFCSQEANDLDACIQNFVPPAADNSYVEQSLQRRGAKMCQPYQQQARKCLEDPKKQGAVFKAAAAAPTCRREAMAMRQCSQRGGDCEKEALELTYCGMVYLVQRQKDRPSHASSST